MSSRVGESLSLGLAMELDLGRLGEEASSVQLEAVPSSGSLRRGVGEALGSSWLQCSAMATWQTEVTRGSFWPLMVAALT